MLKRDWVCYTKPITNGPGGEVQFIPTIDGLHNNIECNIQEVENALQNEEAQMSRTKTNIISI